MRLPPSDGNRHNIVNARPRVLLHALRLAEGPHHHLGGNYYHTQHLARAIAETGAVELILLADEHTMEPLRAVVPGCEIVCMQLAEGGVLKADQAVGQACRRVRPDVFHRPTGQLPLMRLPCRTVASIADLNFRVLPTPTLKRLYKELSYRWTIRLADRITCVSDYTRREVIRHLGAPEEKILVIQHGANVLPPADNALCAGIPGPYWLSFGHQAHKNVETVMRALQARRRASQVPEHLVVVGRSAHIDTVLKPLAGKLGLDEVVYFAGRVDDASLRGLYEGALGLVFLSRYEGFGLPVLEAMECGCPVIASDVCSLPEVAGTAALFFSPDDVTGVEAGMNTLVADAVVRTGLIAAGRKRAAGFTWERAARETIAVYQSLAALTD